MKPPFYQRLGKPWLRVHNLLQRSSGVGFRILTFHDVPNHEYKSFERIIGFVLEHHGILTPEDVENFANGRGALPEDGRVPCLVTFDDGYASNCKVAKCILNETAIKAVFFVCPALMNIPENEQNKAMSRYVYENQPVPADMKVMDWNDLEFLLRSGHTVGSHTLLHPRLSTIPAEERQKEIVLSGDALEKRLGIHVRWFAYPFGTIESIDTESYQIIAERYDFCCTGIRGLNRPPIQPLTLLRDPIDLSAPFDYQRLSLCGGLDFLYARSAKRIKSELCPAK